jgi:glycerate 2-kinase
MTHHGPALLQAAFNAAVKAADPRVCMQGRLPNPPAGRTLVVGAGKAAASMAAAVEAQWPKDAPLSGLVITRYAHGLPLQRIRCVEAGHPVPDSAGQQAAQVILDAVTSLGPQDLLIALVSGGGSSLLSLPVAGVSMQDLQAVTKALLTSGAPITDMNIVRKHLSRIQGGQLALCSRAPVHALVISDVVGDDPSAIASGPCSPDPSRFLDAKEVLDRWGVKPPESVARHLAAGLAAAVPETPKPGDARLSHATTDLIATARISLDAASAVLRAQGVQVVNLGDAVTGEARDVATAMASWVRELAQDRDSSYARPVALVSGGECTVTVRGAGRGGRCSEFLLALGLAVESLGVGAQVTALAADTDGIDGVCPYAGVWLTPGTLSAARAGGVSPMQAMDTNDALAVFEPLGQVIQTGPTRTNVNDFRAILIQ